MPGYCQFMPLHITYSRCCNRLAEKWRDTEYFLALGSKDTLCMVCRVEVIILNEEQANHPL